MTINETNNISTLTAELETVENKMWMINMIDRWTDSDREKYDALSRTRVQLINKLKELGAR